MPDNEVPRDWMAFRETVKPTACRIAAGIASLSGTQEGHLMCDRPAGHDTELTPGYVAYKAESDLWAEGINGEVRVYVAWGNLPSGDRLAYEAAARAVLGAQHHDTTDHILWTRDDDQQTG